MPGSRCCVGPDHAAPAEALAEIAAALIEKSPDRTKLTGCVESLDRLPPDIDDLAAGIPPGSALRIEQTRPERQSIEIALKLDQSFRFTTELCVFSRTATFVVLRNGLRERVRIETEPL